MTAPSLSDTLKHTCDNLRQGATKQVTDYEERFSTLKEAYDSLLVNLIKSGFSQKDANEMAKEFFGADTVRFAGIDGTMYSRPLFDMVIFFGGAYAATGTIKFQEAAQPQVDYDAKTLEQNIGMSSVVPIYVNEIPDVDHSFSAQEQPAEVNPSKAATDEEIANNSLIANAIMTFSEYYLAYKLAVDSTQNFKALLMDRSLSTERAALLYETRKTDFWNAKSTLVGYTMGDWKVDRNDFALARQHVCNKALGLPAPRADYLPYAIVCLAEEKATLTVAQICEAFGIADDKRKTRDPLLRSNVLLIDRLAYPEFDLKPECVLALSNEMSDGTKEPLEVFLYKDKAVPNRMQNLVMTMLVAMAPRNIPEAFGHNKPLFVADKIAKWNYSQFKAIVDSTAGWILNNHKLRKFIFYMSTF